MASAYTTSELHALAIVTNAHVELLRAVKDGKADLDDIIEQVDAEASNYSEECNRKAEEIFGIRDQETPPYGFFDQKDRHPGDGFISGDIRRAVQL